MTLVPQYFGTLREEIHLRIKQHAQLVWVKLAVLGGMISFLVTQFPIAGTTGSPPYYGVFVWMIPLTAVVFDVLIAGNLRDIYNLGHYIKTYLEGDVFPVIRGRELFAMIGAAKGGTVAGLRIVVAESGGRDAWRTGELAELKENLEMAQSSSRGCEARVHERGENEWKLVCSSIRPTLWKELLSSLKSQCRASTEECRGAQIIVADKAGVLNVYRSRLAYWEEKGALAAPEYQCYTPVDMLAIWLFTFGCMCFTFLMQLKQAGVADYLLLLVCLGLAGFAGRNLLQSIGMKREF